MGNGKRKITAFDYSIPHGSEKCKTDLYAKNVENLL